MTMKFELITIHSETSLENMKTKTKFHKHNCIMES